MSTIRGGPPVESRDVIIGSKLRDLGVTLCLFGLDDMGTYLKEISNSPESIAVFFESITTKIKRGTRPPTPPSRAVFASFEKNKERLSEEQVTKLVNLTSSWDIDDQGLEDLKALAKIWTSTPSAFFEANIPSLSGNDGLIELCFGDANHIEDTGSTRRKLDNILLDRALKHKEKCLRERYKNGDRSGRKTCRTNRSWAVDEFIHRRFGGIPEKERKSKYARMKALRISGSKWNLIEPRWMVLALKDAKTNCFERGGLTNVEASALNAYIRQLKAYGEENILKVAYSSILREYKQRSRCESNVNDVKWIDDLQYPDGEPTGPPSSVEGAASPLDTGHPTPCIGSQGGSDESTSANSSQSPQHYPNNSSSWMDFEQSRQEESVPQYPSDVVSSRIHHSNRNMREGVHGMDSPWFEDHGARDADAADAANALSQLHSTRVLASSRAAEQDCGNKVNKRPFLADKSSEYQVPQRMRLGEEREGDGSIPTPWSREAEPTSTRNPSGISHGSSYPATEGVAEPRQQSSPENQPSQQEDGARRPPRANNTTLSNTARPGTSFDLDPNFTIDPTSLDRLVPYQSPQRTIIQTNTNTNIVDPFITGVVPYNYLDFEDFPPLGNLDFDLF
ncbi:hypothetical protein H105_00620 [Trichophyton soudanense CBS 452.61]|uniref:Uncharacterized protein n=2 Tax=Trichophyton soudanense CBS 452.61 TaxID=1215331 RepID=A0A022Y5V9_TRISD|nr:hypothetical protein H105_00620 [Trichophyton soudanense CBS 452.61]EZG05688.1 hypothetical protein H106_04712 [Trichophyton rubrum CBS 735.88]